jgi:4-amino-4-deoxy-L-arabinose transferase-like glycosyltransferase
MPASEPVSWLRRPQNASHVLILGFALLHLLAAARLPLAGHEAHYALYGYYLDLSYVDHPPLVGWLQALVLKFASTDLALRVVPITLSVVSQYLLLGLVRTLYPQGSPWLGFVSVLLLQGMAVTHLAITMAPDAPLVPLSILAVWLTHQVLEDGRWRDWLGLGLVLGLAGLAKYTAVTLALSVVFALLLAGKARAFLGPRPWASALLAAVIISPVLIWNWQHDWVSFTYQFSYQIRKEGATSGWSVLRALRMQGWQVAGYSPLVYAGGILAVVWAVRRGQAGSRLLLVFALPVLLLVSWVSGFGRSGVHWTYVGWVLATPVVADWLMAFWSRRAVRGLAYASAAYSAMLLLFATLTLFPGVPFPHKFSHPLALIAGWNKATEAAERLRRDMVRRDGGVSEPVLLVQNWHHARWLAWYGRPSAVLDAGRRRSQYSVWFGEVEPGTRGILVVPSPRGGVPGVHAEGFRCRLVEEMPAVYGTIPLQVFYFFACES